MSQVYSPKPKEAFNPEPIRLEFRFFLFDTKMSTRGVVFQKNKNARWKKLAGKTWSNFRLTWRDAMSKEMRTILAPVVLLAGLGLMVGGIIVDKDGAVVVGLCVAVASSRQWITLRKQAKAEKS